MMQQAGANRSVHIQPSQTTYITGSQLVTQCLIIRCNHGFTYQTSGASTSSGYVLQAGKHVAQAWQCAWRLTHCKQCSRQQNACGNALQRQGRLGSRQPSNPCLRAIMARRSLKPVQTGRVWAPPAPRHSYPQWLSAAHIRLASEAHPLFFALLFAIFFFILFFLLFLFI